MRSALAIRVAAAVLLAALATGACGRAPGADRAAGWTRTPWCDDFAVLSLAAQSTPHAEMIPCIEAMPIGWTADDAKIDHDGTTFTLDSSIAGDDAARVELAAECEIADHVQVPSDIAGTERFEWVESIESGVQGQRVYVFEGGCVVVDIDFRVDVSAALISEISLALGFVTRDEVNDAISDATDGREQVDPPAAG